MARKPRIFGGSGVYHLIMRGNNKQNLFHDDADRTFFLKRLCKYAKELNIEVYAYCLMTNHVHILIGNANDSMSLLVQKLANSYVYYFNHKYERTGHLFQGRYKSEPILDDAYFKTVYRYIVHNSEKAGLGPYYSYRWNNLNQEKVLDAILVDNSYIIRLFETRRNLMDFLAGTSEEPCMEYENKVYISDEKALEIMKKVLKIKSPNNLEQLPIESQLEKCKLLKENGLSINQISRISGISRKIVKSA